MKNGESVHDEIYKKMPAKPEKEKTLRVIYIPLCFYFIGYDRHV